MNKGKIILKHLAASVVLSVFFFFLSEPITALIFYEIHEVELWLSVLISGLVLIHIGIFISLLIRLVKSQVSLDK